MAFDDDMNSGFDEAAASGFAPGPDAGLFDFSDVKADASGTPPPLPKGVYNCIMEKIDWGASKRSGSLMFTMRMKVINGEFASRTIMDWCILVDKNGKRDARGMAKFKAYLQVIAPHYPMDQFDPNAFQESAEGLNALLSIKLSLSGKAGEERNNVQDILPYDEATAEAGMDDNLSDGLDVL